MFGKNRLKRFDYQGRRPDTRQSVAGSIEAADEAAARKQLLRKGILPQQIRVQKTVRAKRIRSADVAVFTRQLAEMLRAGLPLLRALEIVAQAHGNPAMRTLLARVRADIGQGSTLSAALAAHPKVFDALYCHLVAAAETGGVLDDLLDNLAVQLEKAQALKKKVQTALVYPAAVLLMAAVLLAVMLVFVLPSFAQLYQGMGAVLPWPTRAVMALSDGLRRYGWLALLLPVAVVWAVRRQYGRSPAFRLKADALLLKLPLSGAVLRQAVWARWARTLAALLAAGVPVLPALDAVAAASGNRVFETATHAVRAQVAQGAALSGAMRAAGVFPDLLLQMAAVGEESGSLEHLLAKSAHFYENEVDNLAARLTALMEPVLMIVLGGVVGMVLAAMYLPLFDLNKVLG
ncbi:type II secretion system F family protein [Neisseria leonii]|uniref:type II secretion system F family protein n=1 Tax=Neisseria leonii TaxID=2995413 RepID=UPI0030D472CD